MFNQSIGEESRNPKKIANKFCYFCDHIINEGDASCSVCKGDKFVSRSINVDGLRIKVSECKVWAPKENRLKIDPKKRRLLLCYYCYAHIAYGDTSCPACESKEFEYRSINEKYFKEVGVNQSNSPTNEINDDFKMDNDDFGGPTEVRTEPIKTFNPHENVNASDEDAYANDEGNDDSKMDIESRQEIIGEAKEGTKPIVEFILQEDTKVSEGQVLAPKENKWKCVQCEFMNSFEIDCCQVCFVESPHKGKWSCDACSYYNEAHATECVVCATTNHRPVKSEHILARGNDLERICWFHGCLCRNKVGERFCQACGLDQNGECRVEYRVYIKTADNKLKTIWICSGCGRFNESSKDRCPACSNSAVSRETTQCPWCKKNTKRKYMTCEFCKAQISKSVESDYV